MIDFGPDSFGWTGEHGIRDLLACCSDYIDLAKIYALNALLLPETFASAAVRLYRDAGITPYSGGALFEYAYRRGELENLLEHLRRVGLSAMEVSENYVTLDRGERLRIIERFRRHGLAIVYEFGRKQPEKPFVPDELERVVEDVLSAGVVHVTIEQSEIDMLAASDPCALACLAKTTWFRQLLIEADPYRFPQQHADLLRIFGTEVNLANIAPGQCLRLEGMRRGIGRAVNFPILQ
jgi:phosphosulfolactate synthase